MLKEREKQQLPQFSIIKSVNLLPWGTIKLHVLTKVKSEGGEHPPLNTN